MSEKTVNVICIHWGTRYTHEDINRLYSMVKRNTSYNVRFHVFSNESLPDLNSEITQHPEPGLNVDPKDNKFAYRKEAGLCHEELGGLNGDRVFFFDLDVLIMDNLDALFDYPEDDKFYIIKDWNTRGDHVGQATCYSFVVGTLGFVKAAFEADPVGAVTKYHTASQEFLSDRVIEKFGKLNFWPGEWFQSFRFHCLPFGFMRHFITPKKPIPTTKVLAFHGHPDLRDALNGRWSEPDSPKAAKGWKKIYKACRQTDWIKEYWH